MNNDTSIIYSTFFLENKLDILFTDIANQEQKHHIESIIVYWKNCWFHKDEPVTFTWNNAANGESFYSILSIKLNANNTTSSSFEDKNALCEGIPGRLGLMQLLTEGNYQESKGTGIISSPIEVYGYLLVNISIVKVKQSKDRNLKVEEKNSVSTTDVITLEFVSNTISHLIRTYGLGMVARALSNNINGDQNND